MTKVIISHDIDHLTVWEHRNDLAVPKHLARSLVEFISGQIRLSEILQRMKDLARNKWHNLEDLMTFDKGRNIPSTFFIGVSNGKGIRYSSADVQFWVRIIMKEGFDVGVHGIAYGDTGGIRSEQKAFIQLSGLQEIGIRMHYLRRNHLTLDLLSQAGYAFDSSVLEMVNPYKVGKMWEFPLHIMDGHIFCDGRRWQSRNGHQSREDTKKIIAKAVNEGIEYLTILFHDRYFTESFTTWKEWYIWLTDYLRENGLGLISYREAIAELEAGSAR
ncbi:MAG: hypothetical protein M0Z71_02730 [Nitrospiraceae bacterium]|nr:hypothetical protein [Nitrospiraceae bacterium]